MKLKPICKYNRNFIKKQEIYWILAADRAELIYHGSVVLDMMNSTLDLIKDGPSSKHNPY